MKLKIVGEIPAGSELTPELLDIMISKVEDHLVVLNETVEATKQVSPNPAKQQRRTVKSQKNVSWINDVIKMREHQAQQAIYGQRNSYSKTDHDATFMRVKEDPMQKRSIKNLPTTFKSPRVISSLRDIGFSKNPTDTRTLQPFIEHLKANNVLGHTIVADAGYGSESNYRYLEDEFGQHTVFNSIRHNA
ncbi:transposase [Lactiplantibacillus plantarum]|uniref:transposase n=1 Tax=Lactiplantibacillus plantarum TaxID=1590 RepID=UPI0038F752B3